MCAAVALPVVFRLSGCLALWVVSCVSGGVSVIERRLTVTSLRYGWHRALRVVSHIAGDARALPAAIVREVLIRYGWLSRDGCGCLTGSSRASSGNGMESYGKQRKDVDDSATSWISAVTHP